MDAYSFGMLCGWLLLYNTRDNPSQNIYCNPESQENPEATFTRLAIKNDEVDDQRSDSLLQLFRITLARDPAKRTSDFQFLVHFVSSDTSTTTSRGDTDIHFESTSSMPDPNFLVSCIN